MLRHAFATLLAIATISGGESFAGPFEDGAEASQRGDYETTLKLWRPLAEHGNVGAQFNLGLMYRVGKGVSQDYAEALKWFRLAARQGNVLALTNVAIAYENGQGVQQNYAQAYVWYSAAASSASGDFSQGLAKIQEDIAARLGKEQLAQTQAVAEKCKATHFSQCDVPASADKNPAKRPPAPKKS